MAFELKEGTGSLFKNRRKEADTDPEYNGSLRLGGIDYYVNAWLRKSQAGKTYMALSVRPKQAPVDTRPLREVMDDAVEF
jgi:hypothetical protein